VQELFINNGLDVLPELLSRLEVRNAFLITGNSSYNSIRAIVKPCFKKINTELYFINNSTVENIILGCKKLISSNADLVIGIGGGRIIDAAKLIHTKDFFEKNYKYILQGKYHFKKKMVPLLILPTTSGTGSEATSFSVIYNRGKKFSVESKFLLPDYAVLDVSLVRNMPPYLRACTMFDALSQSIESLWSNNATEFTKKNALESIELIVKNINRGIIDNSYFVDMIMAAHLSGVAINASKTTAAHAYSYFMTSTFNIPHGHAVALILGIVLDINLGEGDKSVKKNMKIISDKFGVDIKNLRDYWYGLMKHYGLEVNLSKLGIKKGELPTIVHSVNLERLANHPVFIDPELMLKKLEEIL
jgi:alcohol dehydrogenase